MLLKGAQTGSSRKEQKAIAGMERELANECGAGGGPRAPIPVAIRWVTSVAVLCCLAFGQQPAPDWQEQVRACARNQEWAGAMRIVDRELARAPGDMEVRGWRARVLSWSGALSEAEQEYENLLAHSPNDADHWLGIAGVYRRQGRAPDALRALDRAAELDPKRADIRIARARGLEAAGQIEESRMEFQRALALEPDSAEARAGLRPAPEQTRHQLRVAMGNDWPSFVGSYHDEGVSLTSQWTRNWGTTVGGSWYQRGNLRADKIAASVTGRRKGWGALTVGGAAGHDRGIIPRREAFFEYDRGWGRPANRLVRGWEVVYAQHWYRYQSASILTFNTTALFYLPKEWMWSVGVTGAKTRFASSGEEWRPSGMTSVGFPLGRWEGRRLEGRLVYAAGTENFAQMERIGTLSLRSYGGGVRLQFSPRQDVTLGTYHSRMEGRSVTSLGFSYGVRF